MRLRQSALINSQVTETINEKGARLTFLLSILDIYGRLCALKEPVEGKIGSGCIEDEGRPLGAAYQEEASNHSKLHR